MSAFGSATLVLDGPSGAVQIDLSPGRASIGRTADNDVVIADAAASSRHCELYSDEVGLVLRDLESANGTYVNGERVDSAYLFDGDLVRIGQSQGVIAVRRPNGRALRRKDGRGVVIAVAVLAGVIIVGGAIALKISAGRRNAEHELFGAYERQAHELLAGDSFCHAISKTRIEALKAADLGTNRTRLDDQLKQDVAQLQTAVIHQKAAVEGLRTYDGKFTDPDLAKTVRALATVFEQQQATAEEYLKGWEDYRAKALANLPATVRPDPAKLREACESDYGKTIERGVSSLAGIAL